jgi:flagellar hook-length control protein FliK
MKILPDPVTGLANVKRPAIPTPRGGGFEQLLQGAGARPQRPKVAPGESSRTTRESKPDAGPTPVRIDRGEAAARGKPPREAASDAPTTSGAVAPAKAGAAADADETPTSPTTPTEGATESTDTAAVIGQWFPTLPLNVTTPAGDADATAPGEGGGVVVGPQQPGAAGASTPASGNGAPLPAFRADAAAADAMAAIPLDADLLATAADGEVAAAAVRAMDAKASKARDAAGPDADAASEFQLGRDPASAAAGASQSSGEHGDAEGDADPSQVPAMAVDADPADDESATPFRVDEKPASDPAVAAPAPRDRPAAGDTIKPAMPEPVRPEQQFASRNVDTIVTSVKGELLGRGGTMQIRLDPPQLGSLEVTVKMNDGVLSASFQTSNAEATRLLSHTLQQLKSTLEASGVVVDRLQVQQAPAENRSSGARDGSDGRSSQQHQQSGQESQQFAHSEQQRREMLRRMWAKLGIGGDPLDLVA